MNKFTSLGFFALLCVALFFTACKKDYESIQSIDNNAITSYINRNNLSSVMVADSAKTGFYYQVTSPGTGNNFKNSDSVFYNYTIKSLSSGITYLQTTTLGNLDNLVGYTDRISNSSFVTLTNQTGAYTFPAIREAILALKPGGTARILLPSYLAFGRNGVSNIPSNENIDFIVTTSPFSKQVDIDEDRISKYLATKGLTAQRDPSGIYYIVNTAGTGDVIQGSGSTVVVKYTGRLLDGTVFDSNANGISLSLNSVILAWRKIIPQFKTGTKFRMFVPSAYGYGTRGSGNTIPLNAVLDFDIELVSVTN